MEMYEPNKIYVEALKLDLRFAVCKVVGCEKDFGFNLSEVDIGSFLNLTPVAIAAECPHCCVTRLYFSHFYRIIKKEDISVKRTKRFALYKFEAASGCFSIPILAEV